MSEVVKIARFYPESSRQAITELWNNCEDAEVVQGSHTPAFGMGEIVWYRVYFRDGAQYQEAKVKGLID